MDRYVNILCATTAECYLQLMRSLHYEWDICNVDVWYITMILLLHQIQIQTLILFIEQQKMLKRVRVHFCCIKGKLEGFLRGNKR